MIVEFLEDCTLELVVTCDEDGDDDLKQDRQFKEGDEEDVDVINQTADTTSFQFFDGSIAYNVPNRLFEFSVS